MEQPRHTRASLCSILNNLSLPFWVKRWSRAFQNSQMINRYSKLPWPHSAFKIQHKSWTKLSTEIGAIPPIPPPPDPEYQVFWSVPARLFWALGKNIHPQNTVTHNNKIIIKKIITIWSNCEANFPVQKALMPCWTVYQKERICNFYYRAHSFKGIQC